MYKEAYKQLIKEAISQDLLMRAAKNSINTPNKGNVVNRLSTMKENIIGKLDLQRRQKKFQEQFLRGVGSDRENTTAELGNFLKSDDSGNLLVNFASNNNLSPEASTANFKNMFKKLYQDANFNLPAKIDKRTDMFDNVINSLR